MINTLVIAYIETIRLIVLILTLYGGGRPW
jgi:hypothetical protein